MPDEYIDTILKTSNFLTALALRKKKLEDAKPQLEYLAAKVKAVVNYKAGQIHQKIQQKLED